jgi:hypothetical protein
MKSIWNPLDNTDIDFHGHEWMKHGTCWNDNETASINITDIEKQKRYFQSVINISKDFGIFEILTNSSLKPSDELRPLKNFEEALIPKLGNGTFDLVCEKRRNKGQFLAGINLCIGLDMKPLNCPYHISDEIKCDADEIYFPVYKEESLVESRLLSGSKEDELFFYKVLSLIYWGMAIWLPMIVLILLIVKRKYLKKTESQIQNDAEMYLTLDRL